MGCGSSVLSRVQPQSTPDIPQPASNFHKEFFLLKKLGKGASASVYALKRVGEADDADGLDLAVKILDLRPKPGEQDPDGLLGQEYRSDAIKEIRVMKSVGRNEYCSVLLGAALEESYAYLVMERASCTMLHHLERKVSFTEVSCAHMFNHMLQGMMHIHGRGVTHRDIKLDNYLLFGSTTRLCDFGLAGYSPDAGSLHMKGIYGTAPFMSPEMLARTAYGAKTDVWSFGVACYVLLFGHFPYRPLEWSSRSMKAAILTGLPKPKFRPLRDLRSATLVSDGARNFAQHLLVRDPKLRPTAREAMDDAWLAEALSMPEEQEKKLPSLHSMLYGAKREGAFDVRQELIEKEWTPMDMELSALQDAAHGDRSMFGRRGKSSEKLTGHHTGHHSTRSTRTGGSRPKIECSGQSQSNEWLDQAAASSSSPQVSETGRVPTKYQGCDGIAFIVVSRAGFRAPVKRSENNNCQSAVCIRCLIK
jgi:serine/threonine protein kinase